MEETKEKYDMIPIIKILDEAEEKFRKLRTNRPFQEGKAFLLDGLIAYDNTEFDKKVMRLPQVVDLLDSYATFLCGRFKDQYQGKHAESQREKEITPEMIDELLESLDDYARVYDHYEYGLPIGFTDEEPLELREIVRNWITKLKERD